MRLPLDISKQLFIEASSHRMGVAFTTPFTLVVALGNRHTPWLPGPGWPPGYPDSQDSGAPPEVSVTGLPSATLVHPPCIQSPGQRARTPFESNMQLRMEVI